MNVAIDTTSFRDSDFTKENVVVGRNKFFAEIEVDKIVEAIGIFNNGTITWISVENID